MFQGGDILWRRRAPVRVGRPRGSLQHLADEGEVRGGPIEGGRWRKWSSPEVWTCGGGSSRFIALDGGSNCRAGQMAMSCCREDGSVICLGWCTRSRVSKRGAHNGFSVKAGRKKWRGSRAGLGAPHGEEEEGAMWHTHSRKGGGSGVSYPDSIN
jgi:hypothetical protein